MRNTRVPEIEIFSLDHLKLAVSQFVKDRLKTNRLQNTLISVKTVEESRIPTSIQYQVANPLYLDLRVTEIQPKEEVIRVKNPS